MPVSSADDAALEQLRAAADDARFPDEVDTPQDMAASVRFQNYRGLDSFRASPWDPKEDLPISYARIFQFESFARTAKAVATVEDDSSVPVGEYVTISIANVPAAVQERSAEAPLVLFSLLQHENRMSVVHFRLTMHADYDTPIKCEPFCCAPHSSQSIPGRRSRCCSARACGPLRPIPSTRSMRWARNTSLSGSFSRAPR